MRCRVLLFAQAAELAGQAELAVDLVEGTTLAQIRDLLCERYGAVFSRFGLAVNQTWASDQTPLMDGDEVAVLPPVSGGAPLLTEEPLDVGALIREVSRPGAGAVAVFIGVVRDQFQGTPSAAVRYHAYGPMAEKVLTEILRAKAAAAPELRLAARHRTGQLAVGEASLVVAVSSPHRQAAFAACREVVEEIKVRLPVWKQELRADGAVWHEEGQLPDPV